MKPRNTLNKPTVLLDVDNTILDGEAIHAYVDDIFEKKYGHGSAKIFEGIWNGLREKHGHPIWEQAVASFARACHTDKGEIEKIFLSVPFAKFWLPGAKRLIDFLSLKSNLVIFSAGDPLFQAKKIAKLGLAKKASEVVVAGGKKVESLKDLISKYAGTKLVVIDDKPEILEAAKEQASDAVTIWIKYGRYAKGRESVGADLETSNLSAVTRYLKGTVLRKLDRTT